MTTRLILMPSYALTIILVYFIVQSNSPSFLLAPSFAQYPRTSFEEDP